MEALKKHLIDKFQDHVEENFTMYCQKHNVEKTDFQLITYLIDKELIPPGPLLRYTVQQEYDLMNHPTPCPKTQAVEILSSRFSISERTVYNILKKK